jgi:23S rRNA (uracil1939-C5)-methyltransferase
MATSPVNDLPSTPHPSTRFRRGQLVELAVTDLAEAAKGFGRLDDGLAVFVEGTVAVGDRVRASLTKIKPNYLEAKLVEVLSPSPRRVAPRCTHFGVCGGCKWQHVEYPLQLELKRKLVADALQRLGGFAGAPVNEPLPAPLPFAYRNKVDFSFGDRRYLLAEEMAHPLKPVDFALGFHTAGHFEKVVDIDRCHIATDEMNAALTATHAFFQARGTSVYNTKTHQGSLRNLVLRQGFHTGEFMVYLITSGPDDALLRDYEVELRAALGDRLTTLVHGTTNRMNNVAYADQLFTRSGPGCITERLGPFTFSISPNSFFQTNTLQAERLYDLVRAAAALQRDDVALDLYCGTGTISLYLARDCARVIGYEQEASSVADAQANAQRNGVTNCTFVQMDLKHFAKAGSERPSVVITDPPRAGMHEDAVAELLKLAPRRIVYVSCNPASLARDGKLICADGRYQLGPVTPVDLFPHTYHVESVAVFDAAQ